MDTSIPLTPSEALSGISATISLTAWIFLLLPQLYENYTHGSADGLSLAFLITWFIGDITNLSGAILGNLLPGVIWLGVWFSVADIGLLGQVLYYGLKKRRQGRGESNAAGKTGEHAPLLSGGTVDSTQHKPRASSFDLPYNTPQHRRRSTASSGSLHRTRTNSLPTISEGQMSEAPRRAWVKNTLSILFILITGTVGWALAYYAGAWEPTPPPSPSPEHTHLPLSAELLGYASAALYLCARLPQIYKNQVNRSTEGLSILFFILSVIGNVSYGAGILFHSLDKAYVVRNVPWLLGSLGTVAEDIVIFGQFRRFGAGDGEVDEQDDEAVV